MFETRDVDLAPWQREAVRRWVNGDAAGPYRGTLEVFTGGGKTLIALACAAEAARSAPGLHVAVVVPTEALARQWVAMLERHTTVDATQIGLLGAGHSATFATSRVIVAVLNTAAKRLPALAAVVRPVMLIVDECHRAGAPTFSRVLSTAAAFRLGLSATPDREEVDEFGEPLAYDEQVVGKRLGATVFRFDLGDARANGWLPKYEVHHHGVELVDMERQRYEHLSRRVDDAGDALKQLGQDPSHAQMLQRRGDEVGSSARAYIALTSQRKDLLYRARERKRIARWLVTDALRNKTRRVLLFHERVKEAADLHAALLNDLGPGRVALEHSRLPDSERIAALAAFRSGSVQALVSVKSLIEGIDVPEADVGISVASSSSVRQRVQSLGRVLRRQFDPDAAAKTAQMHLIYVSNSVDEVIYAKQDWSDLTGADTNHYWRWRLDPHQPAESVDSPPATPKPTEEQEWERLGRQAPTAPARWLGSAVGQEYSVDTLGTVTNMSGAVIANPQDVQAMVEMVRDRAGGRFRVTPVHRLVLVWGDTDEGPSLLVAGQLKAAFRATDDQPRYLSASVDISALQPGDLYLGPLDRTGGTYRLRQKRGGVIERSVRLAAATNGTSDRPAALHDVEFAIVDATSTDQRARNARRVIDAWHAVLQRGITFHVSADGTAWFTEGGKRRFLAQVTGGFLWPVSPAEEE